MTKTAPVYPKPKNEQLTTLQRLKATEDNIEVLYEAHNRLVKRYQDMEETYAKLTQAFNGIQVNLEKDMASMAKDTAQLSGILDGIISILGVDAVTAKINELQADKAQKKMERETAEVAKMLSEGKIVKAEKITKNSILAGREVRPDGTVIPPGKMHIAVSGVKPELQESLIGQTVGFKLDVVPEASYVVDEIYDLVQESAESASNPADPAVTP